MKSCGFWIQVCEVPQLWMHVVVCSYAIWYIMQIWWWNNLRECFS
jgi:hypothetical protein